MEGDRHRSGALGRGHVWPRPIAFPLSQELQLVKSLSVVFSVAILAATAANAGAQASQAGNPVELGIDAVVATTVGDSPNVTTISIPSAEFRVGFFVSNDLSIEPRIGVASIKGGGPAFTTYTGQLGLLYHFGGERVGSGVYVRPFAGFNGISSGVSDTQANLGAGLGTKIPFGDRLATRLEANYMHSFSSSNRLAYNQIGASIGLSFFTR